jgi:hypothetical protein
MPDPDAEAIDSFTTCWQGYYVYAFPPFRLIGRVVQKIIHEIVQGILVVPDWPTKSWHLIAPKIAVEKPLTFLMNQLMMFSAYIASR